MNPQSTQEKVDYRSMKGIISGDRQVRSLKKNLAQTKQTLQTLVDNAEQLLRTRIVDLVVQEGIGFYGAGVCHDRELSRVFLKDKYRTERHEAQGVTTLHLKTDYEEHIVYYSRSLGIWVSGGPELREDGLYCQITGEKISN